MAERYGSFKDLSNGKKGMSAEEAYLMLKQLGMLGNTIVPGLGSAQILLEGGTPREALEDLQDFVLFNDAYQNAIRGKDQDWTSNGLDAALLVNPMMKPVKRAKKALAKIEKMNKGGKGGFIVKPEFKFKKDSHKEATERLANAWTNEVRDNGYIARPQDPHPVTYASKKANDITDDQFRYPTNIARTYKDPSGRTVTENAAQLAAILPENATEAAYIRHMKTPYDTKLKNIRHDLENDRNIRQSFRTIPTQYGFEAQLPTVNGAYANRTDRAKNKIFDDIEAQMPGYREAAKIPDPRYMQERGLNVSTIFDPDIDKKISRQQADMDFWNTLLKDENFMKSTPDPDAVYQKLEESRKKLIDLQNLKTEQTLDALD